MAVTTPQLEEPVYQQKQMAAPPMPEGQQPQVLPAQAGFVSKAGAGAFIATNLLNGWLQGRKIKAEREMDKAQKSLAGADYAYLTVMQNYNNLLGRGKSEQDPEVMKAKEAAWSAWNAKLQVMGQYVMPPEPEKGKKTSVKDKVKGGLGQMFGKEGVQPHLIPQLALQVLKSSAPPGLGLQPQDRAAMSQEALAKAELESTNLKLQQEKQKAADDQMVRSIVMTPEVDRTQDQRQQLDNWKKLQHINDPASQQIADKILTDYIGKGVAIPENLRGFAYAQHLIEGPQTTVRTDGSGIDQLITYSPDGKVLGTVKLGRHYEPDQVGPALRLLKMQQGFMVDSLVQSQIPDIAKIPANQRTPEQKQQYDTAYRQATEAAVLEQSKNPAMIAAILGDTPMVREQQMSITDKALRSVMAEAGGPGADPTTKKALLEKWSNFIVTPQQNNATGMYTFRDQLAPGKETGWWNKKTTYAGGMTPEDEAATQAALYNRVRAEIQKQNPKMTSFEIDRIIPEWLKTPASQQKAGAEMKPQPPKQDDGPGFISKAASATGDVLNAVGGPSAFGIPVSSLFSAFPQEDGAAKPGPDGIWGEKAPGAKVYEVQTDDHGWVKTWLTPQQAQEVKQATPNGLRDVAQPKTGPRSESD